MNALVDTHALLWFVEGNPKLSVAARSIREDPVGNELLFSAASCWEIAIKSGLGKLSLRLPYRRFIRRALRRGGFVLLPIRVGHAEVVATLPLHHRDPFDRMLVAQAVAEGVPIASGDGAFDAYPVRRIW